MKVILVRVVEGLVVAALAVIRDGIVRVAVVRGGNVGVFGFQVGVRACCVTLSGAASSAAAAGLELVDFALNLDVESRAAF